MKGYKVIRKAGWDTHGLPVELEIEKSLGISGKEQIEEYGVEKFVKKCKESVFTYVHMWEEMTNKVGYWVDMENPYVDGGFPGRRPGDCRLSARRDAARHAARLDAADGRRAFTRLGTRRGRHSKESVSEGPAPSALTASLAFSPPDFRFCRFVKHIVQRTR